MSASKENFVLHKLILIGAAGGVGALARYGLAGVVQRASGGMFPWGTVAVNCLGCFAAGFLWTLAEERLSLSSEARACVFVGFIGAFTTFSTYILETGRMFREGEWLWAAGNMTLQNAAGVALLFIGIAAARAVA